MDWYVQPSKEKCDTSKSKSNKGNLTAVCSFLGAYGEEGAILFSEVHSNRTRSNRQVGKWEILIRYKEKLCDQEDGQILEQVGERSCGISVL